jgi:hypothetical protein
MLPDVLKAEDVKLVWSESVRESQGDVIELQIAEQEIRQGFRVRDGHLVLHSTPPYLPLTFTGDLVSKSGVSNIEINNVYEHRLNKPSIQQQDITLHYPFHGKRAERQERRTIAVAPLSLVVNSDYRLPAFGIDEPLRQGSSSWRVGLIAINAAICALIIMRIYYHKRNARAA